jgi:hypothetical protein
MLGFQFKTLCNRPALNQADAQRAEQCKQRAASYKTQLEANPAFMTAARRMGGATVYGTFQPDCCNCEIKVEPLWTDQQRGLPGETPLPYQPRCYYVFRGQPNVSGGQRVQVSCGDARCNEGPCCHCYDRNQSGDAMKIVNCWDQVTPGWTRVMYGDCGGTGTGGGGGTGTNPPGGTPPPPPPGSPPATPGAPPGGGGGGGQTPIDPGGLPPGAGSGGTAAAFRWR